MGYYVIIVSFLIIIGVIIFEILRPKKVIIDFLTGINIIYLLIFGIVPIYLYFFYEYTTWETIRKNELYEGVFLYGVLLSVLCYFYILIGYYVGGKLSGIKKLGYFSESIFRSVSDKQLLKPALILTLVGLGSQVIYIIIIGGFNNYLTLGSLLRSDGSVIQSPFIFLKNIVPLLYMVSFIYYTLFINSKRYLNKFLFGLIFLLTFVFSLLHLYHVSGRIPILYYLLTFPLGHIVLRNSIKGKQIIFGLFLFLFLVVFGETLMNSNTSSSFVDSFTYTLNNLGLTIGTIIEEFSFPYTNIANTLLIFPKEYGFRYALPDLVIGLKNVLPSRLLPFEIFNKETLTSFNTKQFGTAGAIPVDLVSFGYICFGVAGVMIIGISFGLLARIVDIIFSYRHSLIAALFYAYWLFFVASRVMYADPGLVYDNAFKLVVASIFLFVFIKNRTSSI